MAEPAPGLESMMITNHAKAGMWQAEGLSNAAASSYRWFRDTIAAREKQIEAEIASLRTSGKGQSPGATRCTDCGSALPSNARFCTQCGASAPRG